MNKLFKSLWIGLFLSGALCLAETTGQNIPANLWEQRPEGIAVALTLTSKLENNQQKDRVNIFIKNTSTKKKWFWMYDNSKYQLVVYYIGDNGTEMPLGNYTYSNGAEEVDSNWGPTEIKPNEVINKSIELNKKELSIAKSHLVKCIFYILNQKAALGDKVETTPKMLSVEP